MAKCSVAGALLLIGTAGSAQAASIILSVNPSLVGGFTTIGAAVATEVAGNTYTINVAPGVYNNDFSVFSAETVINGAGATIATTIPPPNQKGVFTTSSPLTVNGLSFIGSPTSGIPDSAGGNSSAIREQASGANTLTLSGVTISGFQDGVLTGGSGGQDVVTVSNSQFFNNGSGSGQTHALYVGDAASLTVSNSMFCGTNAGHDVKSRALSTTVTGSTLFVGTNVGAPAGCNVGSASLAIDLPNGGIGNISGDTIIQGDANQNGSLIRYGEEGLIAGAINSLSVTNTAFDNLGTRPSTAIDELSNCITPVNDKTDTFSNTTPGSPAGCISPTAIVAAATLAAGPVSVPEPPTIMLLLISLVTLSFGIGRSPRR